LLGDSPSPFRSQSRQLCNANLMAALQSIDTPDDDSTIAPFRARRRKPADTIDSQELEAKQ